MKPSNYCRDAVADPENTLRWCSERVKLFSTLKTAASDIANAIDQPGESEQSAKDLPSFAMDRDTARANAQRAYAALLTHMVEHGCWKEISIPVEGER